MVDNLETPLVERTLHMAFTQRKPQAGLLHHSDRGSQYASDDYPPLLAPRSITLSMSRTANCYDKAMKERFLATLQAECASQPFATRAAPALPASSSSKSATILNPFIQRWASSALTTLKRASLNRFSDSFQSRYFQCVPMRRKAKRRCYPSPLSYDRLSVMGAISNAGDWLTWMQDHPVKGPDLVRFLKPILAHIPGKILLVWDGLPAHRSQPIKDFLATPAAKRLTLLQLPAYAPELHPQEGLWRYLKYVELANLCCHDLDELRLELRRTIQRLRYRLDVIVGCLLHTNCTVSQSSTA